jgi:hypothetical protein
MSYDTKFHQFYTIISKLNAIREQKKNNSRTDAMGPAKKLFYLFFYRISYIGKAKGSSAHTAIPYTYCFL